MNIILSMLQRVRGTFIGVHRNALVFLIFHPLFIIPFTLFTNYEALYRQAVGLSREELGLLAGILMTVRAVASLFGGVITDRLGRKITTTLTDLICWSTPALIYAFSQNFTWFLVGTIFSGLNTIVSSSFTCMFVEGTRPEKRALVYSIFNIIGISAGFFMPFGGWLVARYGMVLGGRIIYLYTFFSISLMSVIRWFLLKETEVGLERIKQTQNHTFSEIVSDYKEALLHLVHRPVALVLMFIFSIYLMQTSMMNCVVHPLFLTEYLGYSKSQIAIFPTIISASMLLMIFVVLPLAQGREGKGTVIGMFFLTVGWWIMGLHTFNHSMVVVIATVIVAIGWALFSPGLNTAWANTIGDRFRAKLQSIKDLTSALITAPAGYIGAKAYGVDPRLPYIIIVFMFLLGLVLYLRAIRREKRNELTDSSIVS